MFGDFQAEYEGSIPFTRSNKINGLKVDFFKLEILVVLQDAPSPAKQSFRHLRKKQMGVAPIQPKRIMLDSNVHDLIAANSAVLDAIQARIADGRLKLVSTHIQRDELSLAPKPKRAGLLAINDLAECVSTNGAMFDVSRFDECNWGSDDTNAAMVAMMAGNTEHAEDALIVATAAELADVLITNDVRLKSKTDRAGFQVDVWMWEEFIDWLCR
jgi:hypothetical protein